MTVSAGIGAPFLAQPDGASATDNPAWQLSGLWVPSANANLAARGRGDSITLSNTTLSGTGNGQAWANDAGTNRYVSLLTETPTQGCTIVLGGGVTTSGANGEFGVNSTNNTHRLGGHIPYSPDGRVIFDYGGTVSTNRITVASLTIGRNDIWAFTSGPRGMEIWQNGVLRASTAFNPSRTSVSGTAWGLAPNNATWSSTSRAASQWFLAAFSWRQADPGMLCKLTSPVAAYGELFAPRRILVPVASSVADIFLGQACL